MTTKLPIIDPEFRDLVPPLSTEERTQLEQNIISRRKCLDAIILWDGIIIDSHNRYEICMKHEIEFQIKEMSFPSREDVMVWILNNQLGRRNLNSAMRIEMALLKEEMLREKAKKNHSLNGGDKVTNRAALTKMTKTDMKTINVREKLAAEANIGEGTLLRYKQIKNSGDPDLLAKVQSGELTIGAAHKQLEKKNLSKEIFWRLRRVDDGLKFIAKYLPPDDNQPICQEIRRRLRDLYQLQQKLITKLKERKAHGKSKN
ncbi:MAG: hypothetical protein FWC73_12200 [Defluviitaleaceae bacterium]|nr:hypothetical protein [Defluviitaleaceae bacterium]